MNLESCPSWPKEHDWKSCNRSKPVRGFESLALRQKIKSVAKAMLFIFCLIGYKGFEQGGSKRSLRKKTARWTAFADVVKERSDAKATAVAEKSLALRHEKSTPKRAFSGGRGWIRTTEVTDDRFTVCSLWPLGNSPILKCGAGGRTRTPDLLITNQLLYQLSYTSVSTLVYYTTTENFCQHFF